jgi:transcriptional regulator with XRE-family HTH domain
VNTLLGVPVPFRDDAAEVIVAVPHLFDDRMQGWMGTSNHLGISSTLDVLFEAPASTLWPVSVGSSSSFLAAEVSRLRDLINEVAGLTRQEIALAIGVDRRSLSGFARGDIRPTPSRVESLRLLAKVVQYAASRWGERAREVLLSDRNGRTALDLVAAGDPSVFGVLDSIEVSDAAVSARRRSTRGEPLYRAARAHGRPLDTRAGVLRDESVYAQDLDEASAFEETPAARRRGRIG